MRIKVCGMTQMEQVEQLPGLGATFAGFIFYQKKTNFLGALAILNVAISLVLNYYLIHNFGSLGAAYASVISFIIVAVIVIWKADKYFKLPWLSVPLNYLLRK